MTIASCCRVCAGPVYSSCLFIGSINDNEDSLELGYDECFVGTRIVEDKLYCLTNHKLYAFHLPHVSG